MAKIEFPKKLKYLLEKEDSDLNAPIRTLADRVGEILADNKLPFFPDYTDHGTDHINNILKSEVELVPNDVWDRSKKTSNPRLLYDADAAVIIGATLLHDIAMHLRPNGFKELIGQDSRFQPLPWFKDPHDEHPPDRPWNELWDDYASEARRFNDRTLGNIIGLESSRHWKFLELPEDAGQWEKNHFLIVGEFIRRHHPRLAHEIAIYGFPGLKVGNGEGQFPAMGREQGHTLMRLADLIGLTARSHGTSLRVCQSYIDSNPSYTGTPRPMGTAVLYPMALLRVADYFQIDRQRAPAVLLQLRDPQSPVSVQEWKKHLAVENIGPAKDPRAKMVTVSRNLSLELYLQLRELLAGLQSEMDHSTAVLDETYGVRTDIGLNLLGLGTRRVYSNLQSPAFRDSLPYVPERTGFAADPNLLTLLVEPLYGKEPGVGVRELMQNAVDAVCELDVWCEAHGLAIDSLDLPKQEADVLVEFIRREDGTWYLRVQDKGIGMTSDTIQNYFLRAGASFRQSSDWAKEFLDEKGKPRVLRAGRFGVGAFAVFLLGPSFRLSTRHVSADKSMGYSLNASSDSQLIEIQRADNLSVGTSIEVDLTDATIAELNLGDVSAGNFQEVSALTDWFCWDWPKVVRRVLWNEESETLKPRFASPMRRIAPGPEWSHIQPEGFDAVYWTFEEAPKLACNGIRICQLKYYLYASEDKLKYSEDIGLKSPNIAVLDSAANLPVTTQRYGLSQEKVPFAPELTRDVVLSFIAHALVCGPTARDEPILSQARHPLSFDQYVTYNEEFSGVRPYEGLLRWVMTKKEMIPSDPWLYSLLREESCLVWGVFDSDVEDERIINMSSDVFSEIKDFSFAMLHWSGETNLDERDTGLMDLDEIDSFISNLALQGLEVLGHDLESAKVIVSGSREFLENSQISKDVKLHDMEYQSQKTSWKLLANAGNNRKHYETISGKYIPSLPIESLLAKMEKAMGKKRGGTRYGRQGLPGIIFIAELKTKLVSKSPQSLIARIWNECIGPQAIPFDALDRQALIDQGRKHPEFNLHIEAWEEMKKMDAQEEKLLAEKLMRGSESKA